VQSKKPIHQHLAANRSQVPAQRKERIFLQTKFTTFSLFLLSVWPRGLCVLCVQYVIPGKTRVNAKLTYLVVLSSWMMQVSPTQYH